MQGSTVYLLGERFCLLEESLLFVVHFLYKAQRNNDATGALQVIVVI